jgi:hypothetical protein
LGFVSLARRLVLMSVRGPTTAILSFAWPKESIQRKGHPDAALILRSSLLNGVAERGFLPLRQRAASMPHPFGQFRSKAPVIGAAYGRKTRQAYLVCLA